MNKTFRICDWCGKETDPNENVWRETKDWKNIELSLGQYNKKSFDICPECAKKLGLWTEERKNGVSLDDKSNSDKLFEIITSIVNDEIENR